MELLNNDHCDPYKRVRKPNNKLKLKSSKGSDNTNKEVLKGDAVISTLKGESNHTEEVYKINKQEGEGRIISSGTTVHGFHTKFQEQLQTGDIILVQHPKSLSLEKRQVSNIISQRTLIIDTEFSTDLISTCTFSFISKSNEDTHLPIHSDRNCKVKNEISKYSGTTVSYREKKGFYSYKTTVESVDSTLSREDLLDIRVKKNRDKYCWI
ncbi:uncharacterized protein CMU_042040 [Cryptosporidium muris RN66]|uniref:Uncharacterized protein n=1 Tax=Cryptosporidium muris (strain RN66) TaxID=441375 RepID=B6AA90_CRYMR|nr:uncharacterized protein CMU_042040 [Cryptosporidium muris RN66]EEA05131.1 hypothetical protein, conserved [Cryptosporidium muris RN66]|eukprot:XP_002139480.1 hypothetical protein [Cryptosporidium muris RN66]